MSHVFLFAKVLMKLSQFNIILWLFKILFSADSFNNFFS